MQTRKLESFQKKSLCHIGHSLYVQEFCHLIRSSEICMCNLISSLLLKHIISLKIKTSFLLKIHFLRTEDPSSQPMLLSLQHVLKQLCLFVTIILKVTLLCFSEEGNPNITINHQLNLQTIYRNSATNIFLFRGPGAAVTKFIRYPR